MSDLFVFVVALSGGFIVGVLWGGATMAQRIFTRAGGVYVPHAEIMRLLHGEVSLSEHLDMYQDAVKSHIEHHKKRVSQ